MPLPLKGCKIRARDRMRRSVLHLAAGASTSGEHIISYLVENGANPLAEDANRSDDL